MENLQLDNLRAYAEDVFYDAGRFFGAQYHEEKEGFYFILHAPRTRQASVVGEWNDWDPSVDPMGQLEGGFFWVFIPQAKEGQLYKFHMISLDGKEIWKTDPFAKKMEQGVDAAGILYREKDFPWEAKINLLRESLSIYEVHLGSWKKKKDGSFYSYQELSDMLLPYVVEMGYNAIELLPITEHPYDGSWGYQQTGYYAISSRYGDPYDFKIFVEKAHALGLAVIIDWVPCHYPKDANGLSYFDGSALFESDYWKDAYNPQWDTINFDFGKRHVCNFLIGSLRYLKDEYKIDGVRVDAVAHMLYRKEGTKEIHEHSQNFLRELTKALGDDLLLFAEDSSDHPGVTKPVSEGGLGFHFKWNMGWMNDTLRYMKMDGLVKSQNHDLLTFPMLYAFSEDFVLPLSHDEVVHMKGSLLSKMRGSYEDKFSQLRLLHLYQYALPGKKLLFMGGEFGQFAEWNAFGSLDWELLDFPSHAGIRTFVGHLNYLYHNRSELRQLDRSWEGFHWIEVDNRDQNFIAFKRKDKKENELFVFLNFSSSEILEHPVELKKGEYRILLNSDGKEYGGQGRGSYGILNSTGKITLGIAPFSGLILEEIK